MLKNDDEILMAGCSSCELVNGKFRCNMEDDTVSCFWATNVTRNKDMFDFDYAFEQLESPMEQKLTEHGFLGWERYYEFIESIYGHLNNLENWKIDTPYIYIGEQELQDTVAKHVSNRLYENYKNYDEFQKIHDIYLKTQHPQDLSDREKTLLFDKMIHLQHVTGNVYDNLDIEALRNEFEQEIK
ncbi:MAG: hypothetical protein KGY67_00485 [Candidatus Thermoplasmatota archaeon]|nr:hypothetical protein [Candidatus Thermoplasmatota archaeon]